MIESLARIVSVLHKDMFKIVYVAPMKALAQEVQEKFQEKSAQQQLVSSDYLTSERLNAG